MANKKKSVYKCKPMTDGKREIIQKLLQEYDIQNTGSLQEALKDLLGGTIKSMMEAEMDDHLGYEKSQRSDSDNARNGHKVKSVRSSLGEMEIEVPQDRRPQFRIQTPDRQETPERYLGDRPENHLDVRQGNDYSPDF